MLKKNILFVLIFSWLAFPLFSQVNIKDTTIRSAMVYATYAYQFPGGDIAKRFGSNSSIGGGFQYKSRSNWLLGVEGNYLFGGDVKGEDTLLKNISTSEGFVIDANGMYSELVFSERGWSFYAKIGKIIPVLSPNPNCGFVISAGAGYLQHKMRINIIADATPQLNDDYRKGYDRYSNGFSVVGSLGYLFLSNTRLLNFYLGFDFIQAWTQNRRARDFDTGVHDDTKYSDQFYSIRVCWYVPLYKRSPQKFYLY
jgi:hypothetical protein